MSNESFDRLLFSQVGDKWQLHCPNCGQQDPELITGEVLSVLSFSGAHSLCIDCDPAACESVLYRSTEKGMLVTS